MPWRHDLGQSKSIGAGAWALSHASNPLCAWLISSVTQISAVHEIQVIAGNSKNTLDARDINDADLDVGLFKKAGIFVDRVTLPK
jgi:hypothetical protein